MSGNANEPAAKRSLTRRQLGPFLLLAVPLVGVLLVLYFQVASSERELTQQGAEHQFGLAKQIIQRDLGGALSDLFFLAELEESRNADPSSDASLKAVERKFLTFAENKATYSQVRLIDREGRELVRVNRLGAQVRAVAPEQLQDKHHRDYFQQSLRLPVGKAFVSAIDLNQEHGAIERPLRPVTRFSTPVVVGDEAPGNLVVLNYDGESMLGDIGRIRTPGRVFLVGGDGQFLRGPSRSVEWGVALGHGATLWSCFPSLQRYSSEPPIDSGVVWTEAGAFSFSEAVLADAPGAGPAMLLVFHVPRDEAYAETHRALRHLLGIGGVGLLGMLVGTRLWAAAAERRDAAERRLRAEKERLARANADLETLAYIASHDLRAPLRSIDNLSGWIADDLSGQLPEPSERHLDQLRRRVRRMEKLLDDLLAYSRVTRSQGVATSIDLESLLADVLQMLAIPSAFHVRLDLQQRRLVGHATPLETVLRNLIGNAAKHHDEDSGEIVVATRRADTQVEFSVSDDGPGIEEAFHERVVGMFQTLRPRDEVEGSGMGLAIVKRIVESEGGRLRLESGRPRGLTVRFTWPLEPRVEPAPALAEE